MNFLYTLTGFYVLHGLGLAMLILGMGALWTTLAVKCFKNPPSARWMRSGRHGDLTFFDRYDAHFQKPIIWHGIRVGRWNFGAFVYDKNYHAVKGKR